MEKIINRIKNKSIHAAILFAITICNLLTLAQTPKSKLSINDFSIRGTVWAGGNLLPNGRMYVYANYNEFPTDTFVVIDNGSFTISNLDSAQNYFLRAVPEFDIEEEHFPEYFPTYFSRTQDNHNYYWQTAENLTFLDIFLIDTLTINLIERADIFYGHGTISGTVDGSPWGDDLNGSCILLLDTTMFPMKYLLLDSTNTFTFNHIPYGKYYLLIDKFYSSDVAHPVTIDVYSPSINVKLYPEIKNPTSTSTQLITKSLDVYPNPFNNFINIKYQATQQSVRVEIRDVNGKVILYEDLRNSNNKSTINTSNLKNGMYFIKVDDQFFKILKNK